MNPTALDNAAAITAEAPTRRRRSGARAGLTNESQRAMIEHHLKGVVMRHKRFSVCGMVLIAAGVLAGSGSASAPSSATCTGQFFRLMLDRREGVTVGSLVSETAQELGRDFGQTIAGGRELPRDDCGL